MAGIFEKHFQDEDAAREHIEKMRWHDGPVCPQCGAINEATKLKPNPKAKSHARKGVWKCRACSQQFTVLVDSIFSDSHIPLHKWLMGIHLMCSSKKGVSALQLMRELELKSYRSAWFMAHRIRWAMGQEPMAGMLSGTVEADSTLIGGKLRTGTPASMGGKKSGNERSPLANKARVFSVLQREGQVRSFHVPRVTNENIKPIVNEVVSKDAHVITDKASALRFPAEEQRKHSTVNHDAKEYVRHEDGGTQL
jgi:transposase-like protein